MKEEKFPHTRKPLHWWRWGWAGGNFRTMEKSTATGVQKAKLRDSIAEDQCQPALTRLVCSPAWAGGGWGLRLGLQKSDPRERTGVGCVNIA